MVDVVNRTDECLVCAILDKLPADRLLLEDQSWLANGIMDMPGWIMVSTRRHCEGVWSLTDDEGQRLGSIMRDLSAATKAVTGAERIHIMSQGESSPHFHYLIIPRLKGETPVFDRELLMQRAAQHGDADKAAKDERRIQDYLRQA